MVKELLAVVGSLEGLTLGWSIVPAVEEALAVGVPRGPAEFTPLDLVVEILGGRDVPYVPGSPIRAADARRVSHQLAVIGDADFAQSHRAVFAQKIGNDQNPGFGLGRILDIKDRLILQSVVLVEEDLAVLLEVFAVTGVVPDFGQSVLELPTGGDALQEGEGHLVLGLDPGVGLLGVHVLQPAVRIGHHGAVEVVFLINGSSLRIGELGHLHWFPGETGGVLGVVGLVLLATSKQTGGQNQHQEGQQEH